MSDRTIGILPQGKGVLAENGPLRLTIQAYLYNEIDLELSAKAGDYAFDCLEQVAKDYPQLCQRHGQIKQFGGGSIARQMLASVQVIGDDDLTPMASVAGTIADSVADWCVEAGATKVIVDNGGDISLRLQKDASLSVGLRPHVNEYQISHVIKTREGFTSWGINTSGMGGRSLTRGVASAVTAFAENSSLADAAATAIANTCFIPGADILQRPANELMQGSDLGSLPVTVGLQTISDETAIKCLKNGLDRAQKIMDGGDIRGAMLVVKGRMALTRDFELLVGAISTS